MGVIVGNTGVGVRVPGARVWICSAKSVVVTLGSIWVGGGVVISSVAVSTISGDGVITNEVTGVQAVNAIKPMSRMYRVFGTILSFMHV
jgi:hypothetical protein